MGAAQPLFFMPERLGKGVVLATLRTPRWRCIWADQMGQSEPRENNA